jgi:hypothetical protein
VVPKLEVPAVDLIDRLAEFKTREDDGGQPLSSSAISLMSWGISGQRRRQPLWRPADQI